MECVKIAEFEWRISKCRRRYPVFEIAESEDFTFAEIDELGEIIEKDYTYIHIEKVLGLEPGGCGSH